MKTKSLSLLFFLLLSFNAFSQFYDDWELQNPYPTANMLSGISFVNDSTGWIVGERGTLLHTADGGQTWDVQESGTDLWLMNVAFTDENTGFASGNNSMVIYTLDGGETWQRMPGFQWYADPLKSIYVVNPDTVWFGSWNGQIYGCFNYGERWTKVSPAGYYLEINSIWFPGNQQRGIAAGGTFSGDRFYKISDDGGQTWQPQTINDSIGDVLDMFFPSADTGYLLSEKYMMPDYLFKTVDGGTTWHPVYHISGNNWLKLFFLNNNLGYALGDNALYRTTDGGITWEMRSYLNASQALFFTSETTGYVCSYQGEIMKTTDGGENWQQMSQGYFENIFSVAFPDRQQGWAISQSMLLHTDDGGEHWEKADNISLFGGRKVLFTDENHGWLLDDYGEKLYRTADGGEQWTLLGEINGMGTKLFFSDTLNGWFINYLGVLSGTTDGGETWAVTTLPAYFEVKDVVAQNQNVWAVGINQNNEGVELYYSDDGGDNWQEQYHDFNLSDAIRLRRTADGVMFLLGNGSKIFKSENNGNEWSLINEESYLLTDLYAVSGDEIYAVNYESDLVYSRDGGITWNLSETPYMNIKDLRFFSDQGWVAGNNGLIAHVNTAALSAENKTAPQKSAIRIYPNPGSEAVRIDSPFSGGYFQLFSSQGEKVFSGTIQKGLNTYRLERLPAGIYPYRVLNLNKKTLVTGKWVKL